MFVEIEFVLVAVILEHVVERTKGHSRSMVASSKSDIVVTSKVRWKWMTSYFSLMKHVMNHL